MVVPLALPQLAAFPTGGLLPLLARYLAACCYRRCSPGSLGSVVLVLLVVLVPALALVLALALALVSGAQHESELGLGLVVQRAPSRPIIPVHFLGSPFPKHLDLDPVDKVMAAHRKNTD